MIEHQGTILSVADHQILVKIVSHSACAGCRAKAFCSMSDQEEKQITVPPETGETWSVGEEVLVTLQSSLGFKALFLIYLLPLIALLTTLFLLLHLGVSELFAGLSALGAAAFCYVMVWLFRDRIEKEYIFVLKKQIQLTS